MSCKSETMACRRRGWKHQEHRQVAIYDSEYAKRRIIRNRFIGKTNFGMILRRVRSRNETQQSVDMTFLNPPLSPFAKLSLPTNYGHCRNQVFSLFS